MSKKTFALAALPTVLLFAAIFEAARSGEPARDTDEKAIRSLIARMAEDWNKHDMKAFASHFTDDAHTINRFGQWFKGRTKHELHLTRLHKTPIRDQLDGRTSEVKDVRFITPDVAMAHEIAREKTAKTIRTYVLSKKAGQWKVESSTISVIADAGEGPRRGQPADADAILDKAIKALGGEEKLSKIKAATWKTKGTISFGGQDGEASTEVTVEGLDHFRQEFDGIFGGKGLLVLAGDKGWRKFGGEARALDKQAVADLKRTAYLTVIPITILPLKSKEFKVEPLGEEKADGKLMAGVKVTGSDGKEFRLYFDKESGLPVKHVAKVAGFMGGEVTQEMRFFDQRVTKFEVLDKVDPKKFAAPK
jgi:uncharacterized protein (TIGR02246 family)